MKRYAVTTLALALAAASGSALAQYQDNGYDSGVAYSNGSSGYPYNSGYQYNDARDNRPRYDVAQVTHVDPIIQQGQPVQRQECWNEPTRSSYNGSYSTNGYNNGAYQNGHSNAGATLLGAVIGGALGNQVGKGDGRTAATIAGAVIGGSIGNNVAQRNDNQYAYGNPGVVRRCRMVSDYRSEPRVVGYRVTYRYAGQTYRTTTAYQPGRTIRVAVIVQPQDNGQVAYR